MTAPPRATTDWRALDNAMQRPMATMAIAKTSDNKVTGMLYPARAGIVRQHRDEVGGPDSAAGDGRIEADPDRARSAARRPGPMKQADGDRAGERADGACQYDQTPVMLGGETG